MKLSSQITHMLSDTCTLRLKTWIRTSRWDQLLQSPLLASQNTLSCLCWFNGGGRGSGRRRNRVPLMNNLSIYLWVTQWGLNPGVAVMFFHKRKLSGEASRWRTAVPAVCPVELSLRLQPETEARQHIRRCHRFHLTHGRKWSLMTSNFLTFHTS